MDESTIEKDLRLLLRAEFADFKLALFRELQQKLDAKADLSAHETLKKQVHDLAVQVGTIIQTRDLQQARESGMWFAVSKGKAVFVGLIAAIVFVADITTRYWPS